MTDRWFGRTVFVVALAVRLAWLWSIHDRVFFTHLQTEPARYDAWSIALASGTAPFRPPFDEAPGYPLLLAAIRILIGRTTLIECGVQALLDATSCALVARFAARAVSGRAGWVAGLLGALYGPAVYFVGQLEPASLVVFAVAAGLAATPTAPTGRGWTRAGAVWALGMFARSEVVLAWPFVVAHAALVDGRRAAARVAAVPVAVLGLTIGVNSTLAGQLVGPTTGAGVNLWIGDGRGADGVDPFVTGARAVVVEEVEASAHDPVAADRAFARQALADVRAEPGRFAALVARKAAWSLTARELPNAADIEWQTAQTPLSRGLLGFGVLLPLACAGAVFAPWRRLAVLAGPIAVGVAAQVVFLVNARFRMPLAPALVVLAAVGVDAVLARPDRRRLGWALAAATCGAVVAWSNPAGVWSYRIPAIDLNTAALELTAGDFDAGLRRMDAAVRARPDDPLGWMQLATSLERLGRVDEAGAVWVDAVQALPDDPQVSGSAARFVRRHPSPTPARR